MLTSAAEEKSATVRETLDAGLLLTPDFPPALGGIANYLFSIYSNSTVGNFRLIAPDHPACDRFDRTQRYRACRFHNRWKIPGLRSLEYTFRSYWRAEPLVRQNPRTILHCGHILAGSAAMRLKWKYGTRYLVWTHALEIMDKRIAHEIRRVLLGADCVLTNSEYTRGYIQSLGVSNSLIKKIRPGVDGERFRPGVPGELLKQSLGIENRCVLLTVGAVTRRYHYKGQDMVIRALPKIVQVVPNVVYVIAGAVQDREYLLGVARECGVAARVKIIGPVSADELPALYNCADVFVMCSREERARHSILAEGFGIAFLEASSCGKAVVGGNSGGVPDAIVNGVTGFLVDPTNPEAIARTILRLLTDPALAEQLGKNGRSWVEQEMNIDRAAREFSAVLQYFQLQSTRGLV